MALAQRWQGAHAPREARLVAAVRSSCMQSQMRPWEELYSTWFCIVERTAFFDKTILETDVRFVNTKSSSRVKILVYLWLSNYCS